MPLQQPMASENQAGHSVLPIRQINKMDNHSTQTEDGNARFLLPARHLFSLLRSRRALRIGLISLSLLALGMAVVLFVAGKQQASSQTTEKIVSNGRAQTALAYFLSKNPVLPPDTEPVNNVVPAQTATDTSSQISIKNPPPTQDRDSVNAIVANLQATSRPDGSEAAQKFRTSLRKSRNLVQIDDALTQYQRAEKNNYAKGIAALQLGLVTTTLLILISLIALQILSDKAPLMALDASQYRTYCENLRKLEIKISMVNTRERELKNYLNECTGILRPIQHNLNNETIEQFYALKKLVSVIREPDEDIRQIADACRNAINNIIQSIEDKAGGVTQSVASISGVEAVFNRTRENSSPDKAAQYFPSSGPSQIAESPANSSNSLGHGITQLQQQNDTLSGTLKQRDDLINAKTSEIKKLNQALEADRTANAANLSNLSKKYEALLDEKNGLEGQLRQLNTQIVQLVEVQRQTDAQFKQQLSATQARSAQDVQKAKEQLEDIKKQLRELQAKFEGRDDALVASQELAAVAQSLPKDLEDFVGGLIEIAEQCEIQPGQRNADAASEWLRKNLKQVEKFVYQSPPSSSRLLARYPQFDQPLRLQQISTIQRWIHQRMKEMGFEVIDPIAEKPFDPRFHEADEQHLIWVPTPEKNNLIDSVVRLGFKFGDKVLRAAVVKKYVYLQGSERLPAKYTQDMPEPADSTDLLKPKQSFAGADSSTTENSVDGILPDASSYTTIESVSEKPEETSSGALYSITATSSLSTKGESDQPHEEHKLGAESAVDSFQDGGKSPELSQPPVALAQSASYLPAAPNPNDQSQNDQQQNEASDADENHLQPSPVLEGSEQVPVAEDIEDSTVTHPTQSKAKGNGSGLDARLSKLEAKVKTESE